MRKHLTTVVLMILVLLSLFLTYYNVMTPSVDQEQPEPLAKTEVVATKAKLDTSNVFAPVELIHYENNELTLYREPGLIKKMVAQLSGKLSELKGGDNLDLATAQFFGNESWQLVYKSPIPLNLTGLMSTKETNPKIDRVVALKNRPNSVYFINEEEHLFYEAAMPHENQQMVKDIVAGAKGQAVDYFEFRGGVAYLPIHPVTMEKESFLSEISSADTYVGRFFTDTLGLAVHSSSNVSQYTNSQGELKIDSDINRFFYRSTAQLDEESLDDRLQKAHQILSEFESWPYEIHYTGSDQTDEKVYFRRYYKNRPIFGSPDRSVVAIIPGQEKVNYLSMPSINLLLRLNRHVGEEQLSSGSDMVEEMKRMGYDTKKIEDACIGYDWTISQENNRVVVLVPKWFIRYQGIWRSLEEWAMKGEDSRGLQSN